ncbi:MAG: hypothetical protein DM484_27010 [Candidatus Methylumidiphilus alinenensis]|uniref:Peptidase M15C domain-containing protein n=1 Tax=Candidatus Methylumidiphilus alinenensis TaxID=2202197 RepID=A0A2W4S5T8_9GAMM|nr:MAG: hypothetical protein DM484_27010 [Candidatus Methylumidiphilus alinenensis]
MLINNTLRGFLLVALTLAAVGCSTIRSTSNDAKAMGVEPAPNAGFIEHPALQAKRADLPFQKVWIKPGFEKSAYRELVVAPVNTHNQRRAAFEGRLRDMDTGEVVATFADRDMADAGPLDLTRLTWYGPAKGIMDRWVAQFVQIANRKPWRGGHRPDSLHFEGIWKP